MDEITNQIQNLESKLALLESENKSLKQIYQERLRKEFEEIEAVIVKAVERGDKLDYAHSNLEKEIEKDFLLVLLTKVNNPNSDDIGFTFTKVINDSVESCFTKKITNPEIKENFGTIIGAVVKNPVLAAILTSNPVTGMVYRVMDKITDFFTNNPFGAKMRQIKEEADKVLIEDNIKNFTASIQTYISFYDTLIQAADQYNIAYKGLAQRRESLSRGLKNYYTDLLKELGIEVGPDISPMLKVSKLLAVKDGKYHIVLNNDKVIRAYNKAREYGSLEERFNNLYADYKSILAEFLDAYLRAFENMSTSTKANFNMDKVEKLKNQIKKIKQNLSIPD